MNPQSEIRSITLNDAAAVCDIYNYYVRDTVITFEEEPVSIQEMKNRIRNITAGYPWVVLEESGEVLGYAYAAQFKARVSYRYSAEITIYLKKGQERKGLGTRLMSSLVDEMRKTDINALVSCITLPNEGSAAIHEKFGFAKIAHFKEVGFKFDKWLDVGYCELILK